MAPTTPAAEDPVATEPSRVAALAGLDACQAAMADAFGADPAYVDVLAILNRHLDTCRMFVNQIHDNTPYRLHGPA